MMLRIWVDFNAMTPDAKQVHVNEHTQPDLDKFVSGQRVIVYEPNDFEVEGVLEKIRLEDGREVWQVEVDWSTRRDLP